MPGEPGPKGRIDYFGSQVLLPGDLGDKGVRGAQGEKGDFGYEGYPGLMGGHGEPGELGDDGNPGFRGRDGEPGIPGRDGAHGRDAVYNTYIMYSLRGTSGLPGDGYA